MLNLSSHIKLDASTASSPNLAEKFSEGDREAIAACVWDGYEKDLQSRSAWETRTQAAMDLALQLSEERTYPFPNSSNVAFPLVTIASLQFHSRAYPTLISGPEVVKARVVGPDPDGKQTERATRISCHMSYQVLEEDSSWEEQHDRLLLNLPIVGCAFKKSYHDGAKGHNVSELVLARDLVLDYYAKSVEECGRKTHVIPRYRNELYSRMASGVFVDHRESPWFQGAATPHVPTSQAAIDRREGKEPPQADSHTPFTTLEQHTWLDLDGDGYEEPYVVTIEAETRTLLRLIARWSRDEDVTRTRKGEIVSIRAEEYFTKYGLIPAPDGSVYDLGFGILLGPLNESVNTLVNILINSGHMHSVGGGFLGRGAKIRGGTYAFAPNEWKRVDSTGDDLHKSIFPLPTKEPSSVLFQLLGLLINYTERVSGSTDMMVGENPGQNTPAETSRTMIEQGMKIYTAIFKRVWRSMKEEFKKLYILNGTFITEATAYGAQGYKAFPEDYRGDPSRVVPAADPNLVSDSARVQQAVTIKQSAMQTPGYNRDAVERNLLRALRVEGIETLFPGTEGQEPPIPEKIQIEQMRLAAADKELQAENMRFAAELMEERRRNDAEIMKIMADIENARATAQGDQGDRMVGMMNAMVSMRKDQNDLLNKRIEALLKMKDLQLKEREVNQAPEIERIRASAAKAKTSA